MTQVQLYWFLKLDQIIIIFEVFYRIGIIIGTISIVILLIFFFLNEYEKQYSDYEKKKKIIKKFSLIPKISLLVGIVCILAQVFIPTTKQMAIMYVVPKIVNNEQIQEIPSKIIDLTNDWLEELKPGGGEK